MTSAGDRGTSPSRPAEAPPLDPMPLANRSGGRWRWALALLAMAFVLYQLARDPETLERVLSVPPPTLAWLALLFALSQALLASRLSLAVAHSGGGGVPAGAWLRLIAVGQLLNTAAPQAGSVYRAVVLKRQHGVPYFAYATGLLAFVWLDLVMGVLLALGTIAVLEPGLRLRGFAVLPVLGALFAALILFPSAGARLLSVFSGRHGFVARVQARAVSMLASVRSVLRAPAFLLRYLLLTAFVTLEQVATLWLLFRAVGAELELSTLLLFQVVFKLSTQVVITPGNLGVTEILFGLLSHGVESTLEQGLAVSVLYRAVSTVMVVLLGVGFGGTGLLFGSRQALGGDSPQPPDSPPGESNDGPTTLP